MRLYVVEDLQPEYLTRLKAALDERELAGSVEGIFWLPVPESMLSPEQQEHASCGPHAMALEVGPSWLRLELLVRARSTIRCSCIQYAQPELRAHMIDWVDTLLKELDIPV